METSVLDYFQRVAAQWDSLRANYYDESVIVKALEHAQLTGVETVVDTGTGTGFMAAGVAPSAKRVIGVDFSAEMLNVARDNIAKLGLTNVVFRQGDMEHLPVEDGSADAVLANMALHHAPDPLAALREMTRVLQPGGRLVITDETRHPFEWFRQELADVWLGFTREEIENWFGAVGLAHLRCELVGRK